MIQYKQKKEAEKVELYELYQKFLEKKTIKNFVGIIANYTQIHKKYSIRNLCWVLAQEEQQEDHKFVGILNGFVNWKKQDIQILKDSIAYKVLVPIFTKARSKGQELDSENQEEKDFTKYLAYFKLGNVFDISQITEYENYLKEQHEIDRVIMKNAEVDYKTALNFAKEHFPELTIKEEFKHQETKGCYIPISKEIILYEQSSHTIFHELGHHITKAILKITGDLENNYAKNEILAELTAYLLMKRFDEQVKYNFAYSNIWSNRIKENFEVTEFEKDFKVIAKYLDKFNLRGM